MTRPLAVSLPLLFLLLAGCRSAPEPRFPEKRSGLNPADRKAWRDILHWSDECEEGFSAREENAGGIEFYSIEAGVSLIEVSCARGAYQGSRVYYLLEEPKSRPLTFRTYEASGPQGETLIEKQATEVVGSAEYSPDARELKIWNRYRGPGDCGSYAIYRIAKDGAHLKEFRAKVKCDGEGAEHPENWPLISNR